MNPDLPGLFRASGLQTLLRGAIDLLLPASCVHCEAPVDSSPAPLLCKRCWDCLEPFRGTVCPRCGALFDSSVSLVHSPGHVCSSCRRDPPAFDQALSAGYFEGPLGDAIRAFKYRPCRALGGPLASWMSGQVRLEPVIDLVMPVPLHVSRLRERGFNQAAMLARGLGASFGMQLSLDNLARIRQTRPQVELAREERASNVAGAFALRRPAEASGRTVLLVDDVYTTGATLHECAKTLKDGGASCVMALTLARAL